MGLFQVNLFVDDFPAMLSFYRDAVDCDPVIDEAWGSYASFRDPEGNWLQIYAVLDRAG
jgi:hypothetical protein